jgi:cytochrome P450
MPHARDALRQRRLIGTPFAKKFLLDQEHIFKRCTKKMIDNLEKLRAKDEGKVDVAFQFMQYSFDLLCKGHAKIFSLIPS